MSEDADLEPARAKRVQLADFLRESKERILEDWEGELRRLPVARQMERPRLRNHIPQLLDQLADLAEQAARGGREPLSDHLPDLHAKDRLDEGFSLEAVTTEYALLRKVAFWRLGHGTRPIDPTQLEVFHEGIDLAIARAVARYAATRDKTLRALDRLSAAALGSGEVDTFLNRLLGVLPETTEAVDTAVILLLEGGLLRVRASTGLEEDEQGSTLRLGEGFAGTVAQARRPLMLRSAATDPLVVSGAIKRRGVRALYGVPMEHEGELIGVAHVGSLTAYEFSADDRQLFRAMARRATSVVVQAQLLVRERQARAQAERSLALLDTLLAAAPVGIGFVDAQLRYLQINAPLAQLNGLPPEEHLGRTVREVLGERADAIEPMLRRILATGEALRNAEVTVDVGPPAPQRTLLLNYYPVKAPGGQVLGAGGVVVDISERKQAEEELRRAVEFKDRFLGIVGHDLRNPLSAIKLSASLLARNASDDPRLERSVSRISAAAQRISRMLDDLLDYTRGRLGGGIPLQPVEADMGRIAADVVDEHRAAHPERQIQLEVDGEVLGAWDAQRVSQALGNLLSNALRHGGSCSPVRVSVRAQGPELWVEVWNTGRPIPPERQATLFDPSANRAGAGGAPEGLGLGLYIVQEIVRAHGGRVEVRSSPEAGTSFTTRWPRRPPPA